MKNTGMWVIVIVFIAAVILFKPYNMQPGKVTTTPPEEQAEPGYTCPIDITQVSYSAEDQDAPGTAVTVGIRYWVNNLPKGTGTTAQALNVSAGDKFAIWFGSGSATYYGNYAPDTVVPCKGTYFIPGKLWTKDNGVSLTLFDEYENPMTGAANNQSIGFGESVQIKARVKGIYQKYYGNPSVALDNIVIFDYDRTEISTVKISKDGTDLKVGVVPALEPVSSVDNTHIGYLMPKVAGSSNVDYMITVTAKSDVDPIRDISVKIFDADYFYDSQTGKIEMGYEDQANVDIGATTEPTATIYLD